MKMEPTPQHDRLKKVYAEALDLATELHDGIWEDAVMWLQTPSELFFGVPPAQPLLTGDHEIVLDWLRTRLGKIPGE